jgi:hypothetical protein
MEMGVALRQGIPQRIWKQRDGHACSRCLADEDHVSEVSPQGMLVMMNSRGRDFSL